MQKLLSIFSLLLSGNYGEAAPVDGTPRVTLGSGTYEGLARKLPGATQGIHVYLGVPFASPPTRFSPPQPAAASSTVRQAQKYAPACIQAKNSTATESEDCLYLNVFAPIPNGKNDKAVMVFLYGGGLQSGDGSSGMYDGTSFATNQDVIIVVPNYRANVFGFPGPAPGLPLQQQNLGFLDQRMAFDFVQKEISKFGGDPKKVTIFGQSAGARSADFHALTMQSPPFRAVIMESGSAELVPLADFRKSKAGTSDVPPFIRLASAVGCDPQSPSLLSCMQKIPTAQLKNAVVTQKLYFPCVDDNGFTTVKDQKAVRNAKKQDNVPIMLGTNSKEQSTTIKSDADMSMDDYFSMVFPDPGISGQVKKAYKVGGAGNSRYASSFDAISAVETDFAYTCLTSREATISAEAGNPTWRYYFNASYENTERFPGSGAYHGAELPIVFGNLQNTQRNLNADAIFLSRTMQKAWADFAKDPIIGPGWPKILSEDRDLGAFTTLHVDGKNHLMAVSPKEVDKNCAIFQSMYDGRA